MLCGEDTSYSRSNFNKDRGDNHAKSKVAKYRKKGTIFCVSPPCLNYWENEEILHRYYQQYRIPPRPHKGVQAELFNISRVYLFQTMPSLVYETKKTAVPPTKVDTTV